MKPPEDRFAEEEVLKVQGPHGESVINKAVNFTVFGNFQVKRFIGLNLGNLE